MAAQKPIIRLSRTDECVEGDCACPDMGGPAPETRWGEQGGTGEQDCACPDAGLPPSLQTVPYAGSWHHPPDLYRAALSEQHEIVFAPVTSTGIAVLNAPARRILDTFATPRRLPQVVEALPDLDPGDISHVALQLARHGLVQPAGAAAAPCQAPPHTLTVWLHITNRCNLRCAYCYAPKGNEDMDEATGRAAIEAALDSATRHSLRTVKLKYAGGEPLLNFSLVRTLHAHAEALVARHNLALREVLLSNGVLLPETTITALRDMGIRLAISLDGIGETHDAQRGAGTFVRVAWSVDRAIALGLKPHISITVTAQNAGSLDDAVSYVLKRNLPFNLNFYREHTCAPPGKDLRAEAGRLIEGVRAALAQIEDCLPQQSIVGGLLDRANLGYPHRRPCGAGQSYVVIDPQGRIARCHMELEKTVGSIWQDDPVTAIRAATDEWRNLEVDAKRECRGCIWRYWCAGGCPLLTLRLTGREDLPSPYCEVYRTLFPEVLRLEGLRLLKWGP